MGRPTKDAARMRKRRQTETGTEKGKRAFTMPLFRVCDPDRKSTKLVSATSLKDLIEKSQRKLNLDSALTAKIVLECDGAEVDEEEIFQELANSGNSLNTLLMLIVEHPESELDTEPSQLSPAEFPLDAFNFSGQASDFTSFEIPWSSFPKNFMAACQRQLIPDVSDRRKMIRILADAMMQINTRPPRHCIRQIAEEVVRVYPQSLADRCGVGRQSDSMFFFLENRIANCNRGKCIPLVAQGSHFELPVEDCGVVAAEIVNPEAQNGDFSTFSIPWNRFPSSFMESCQRKEVPDVSDRRKMIRILADAMMQINRRPPRHVIRSIAENVVGVFPLSLADRSGIGNLYDSIFFCLDNRIAHCNRGKCVPSSSSIGEASTFRSPALNFAVASPAAESPTGDLTSFEIPWHKFPPRFTDACQEEAIPEISDRREMIRVLADEVMLINARPSRQSIRRIAERVVSVYPRSLEDRGSLGANKYDSIFLCLDNRIAHCNRKRGAANARSMATFESAPQLEVKQENGSSTTDLSIGEFASFNIPFDKFPPRFVKACNHQERPELPDKQGMIRVLADEMMRLNRRPPLRCIRHVAKALVAAFPQSLADEGVTGNRYDGICICLENRISHCNRRKPSPVSEAVEIDSSVDDDGADSGTSSNTDDNAGTMVSDGQNSQSATKRSYECVAWQPNYPVGETAKSQEEKRSWLHDHFHSGETRDYEQITNFMDSTYASQRSHINGKLAPLLTIKTTWPFLFEESFLLQHAEKLLGKKLKEQFAGELWKSGKTIVEHCLQNGKQAQCAVVVDQTDQGANELALSVVEALATYFQDDLSTLFQLFDDDTPTYEIEGAMKVSTPVLVVAGNSLLDTNARIYVVIEGKVYLRVTDFFSGFVTMFAAYYCFNLAYAESSRATLEFIQLELMKIIPNKGNKQRGKIMKTDLDPRVLKLLNVVDGLLPI